MSENKQLSWKELEELVNEIKEEAHTQLPAFYVTKHLPFEVDKKDENGELVTDDDGMVMKEMIHCVQVPAGFWMSAEAADKLQEIRKNG